LKSDYEIKQKSLYSIDCLTFCGPLDHQYDK
jgi:hypothetical protein